MYITVKKTEKMRFVSLFLAIFMLFALCLPVMAEGDTSEVIKDNPELTSNNAVVAFSADDGQLLWENRKDERVAPTVATKLVTTMVVMDILKEYGFSSTNTYATVTQAAIDNCGNIYDPRVPIMSLTVGKTYSVKDLLAATIVNNAYDAASVLAYHFGESYCGGSVDGFIAKMNDKVKALGLKNTKFVNATGVDNTDQYTTPYEVAMIAAAFYKYNELVNYSNVSSFTFNGSTTVRNKNFLKNDYNVAGYLNKKAIGLIAGQLNTKGNYCLITAVQDQGRTYIFVVMCASGMKIDEEKRWSFVDGNAYDDMNKLISWMLKSFQLLSIATTETIVGELRVDFGNSSDHVMVVPSQKVERLVLKSSDDSVVTKVNYDTSVVYKKEFNGTEHDTVSAPVTAGQCVGTVTFSYNGNVIATVDAVTKNTVEEDSVLSGLDGIKSFLFGPVMKTVLYIIGGIVIAYIVVVIVMAVVRGVNRARAAGGNGNKKPTESKQGKDKGKKTDKNNQKKTNIPKPRNGNPSGKDKTDTKETL